MEYIVYIEYSICLAINDHNIINLLVLANFFILVRPYTKSHQHIFIFTFLNILQFFWLAVVFSPRGISYHQIFPYLVLLL